MSQFNILPPLVTLSKFQREEYAKLWFDLSKISVATLVVKLFEQANQPIGLDSLIVLTAGLINFVLRVKVGMSISKETL